MCVDGCWKMSAQIHHRSTDLRRHKSHLNAFFHFNDLTDVCLTSASRFRCTHTHTQTRTLPIAALIHAYDEKKKYKNNYPYNFFGVRRLIRQKMWENKNFNCNCFALVLHTICAPACCVSALNFIIFCVFLLVDNSRHHKILRKVKKENEKNTKKKSEEEETIECTRMFSV